MPRPVANTDRIRRINSARSLDPSRFVSAATTQEIPDTMVQVTLQWVSPDIAKEWLDKNIENNRKLSQTNIRTYAEDMEAGRWHTGSVIRFDWDGRLIDGQNRLNAVIRYGMPVQFAVMTGLDPSSVVTIDTGRRRTPADALQISGVNKDHATTIAPAISVLQSFFDGELVDANSSNLRKNRSNQDVVDAVKDYPEIEEVMEWYWPRRKMITANRPALCAAMVILLREAPRSAVMEFFGVFSGESAANIDDPRFTMRKWMADNDNKAIASSANVYRTRCLFVILRCWNAWLLGSKLTNIRLVNQHEQKDDEGNVAVPARYVPMPAPKEWKYRRSSLSHLDS